MMKEKLNTKSCLNFDFQGQVITKDEHPDTLITVWGIEPTIEQQYDSVVIRGYQESVRYAKSVVESLMDDPEMEYPVVIKISQIEMSLRDYEDIMDSAD